MCTEIDTVHIDAVHHTDVTHHTDAVHHIEAMHQMVQSVVEKLRGSKNASITPSLQTHFLPRDNDYTLRVAQMYFPNFANIFIQIEQTFFSNISNV